MTSSISEIKKAIDPAILDALRDVAAELQRLKIPFFMIGAIARDVVSLSYEAQSPRKTTDLDLGIMVDTGEQFMRARRALVESGRYTSDPKQEQRVLFKGAVTIDLVPFGGIEEKDGKIHLPPSRAFVMNVRGFSEAYDASTVVPIDRGLEVKIATVEGLIVLKLMSWNDRPAERERDAEDLAFLLAGSMSFDPTWIDTLYVENAKTLEENGYVPELASIELLATRIRAMVEKETLELLKEITGAEPKQTRLVAAMLAYEKGDRDPDEVRKKLIAFRRGLG